MLTDPTQVGRMENLVYIKDRVFHRIFFLRTMEVPYPGKNICDTFDTC